jgi:hypothetical protein
MLVCELWSLTPPPAQELKIVTRDHERLMRQKNRLLNQIEVTLKEYYSRPLEVFGDLETKIALDFLKAYPTPQAVSKLNRRGWNSFARRQHHLSERVLTSFGRNLTRLSWQFPSTW